MCCINLITVSDLSLNERVLQINCVRYSVGEERNERRRRRIPISMRVSISQRSASYDEVLGTHSYPPVDRCKAKVSAD